MSIADIITITLESYLDDVKADNSPATYFHASKPPSMPIYEYLKRLEEFMKCSNESFILALIYLDRITERESDFVINYFLLTAISINICMSVSVFYTYVVHATRVE